MSETPEKETMAHEVCPRCNHFSTCRVPCYPVAEYLRQDNLAVFEKSHTDENGQTVTILFSRSREIPESDLPQEFADTGTPADKVQRVFNTDSENPFSGFSPNLKQTGIFVDRFFHKLSYADLSVKYETCPATARKIYHNGVKRVLELLKMMDEKPRAVNAVEKPYRFQR